MFADDLVANGRSQSISLGYTVEELSPSQWMLLERSFSNALSTGYDKTPYDKNLLLTPRFCHSKRDQSQEYQKQRKC